MSMLRLLSAGKSLIGSRDTGKEYRMVDVRSLPTFGAKVKKAGKVAAKERETQGDEKIQTQSSKLQRSSNDQAPNFQAAQESGVSNIATGIGEQLASSPPKEEGKKIAPVRTDTGKSLSADKPALIASWFTKV